MSDKNKQHQGEPVAWRGINELGEVVTDWVDGVPPASMVDLCGNPASFAKIERAYTHADPGEVERLRDERDTLIRALETADSEVNTLRAQLAEAHRLLRHREEMLAKVASGWPICIYTKDNPLLIKTCGELMAYSVDGGMMTTFDPEKMQLSASAEPSSPLVKAEDVTFISERGASAPVELDELTDEQIIEAMRSYLNDADGGYVVDTAPDDVVKAGRALLARAGSRAPVERDERAEFEKHYASKNDGFYPSAFDGEYDWHDAQPCWEAWQARAALERKQQKTPQ